MTIKYLSVCSGIEAASVAWAPIGWRAYAVAEIEAFPSTLLAQRYPETPNLGDITKFQDWPDATIDLLVGGTPCQSFSVAGLRKGLADPRGNLALAFLGIADRYRPEWLVWENVPGVLSVDGGRAFGSILGGMAKLGYGFAYRVLDAQYVRVDGFGRAVPQRRRRVFVVGNLRDWRRAAAVLFEPESLSGNPPPRREAGQGIAHPIGVGSESSSGYRNDADTADNLIAFGGNDTGGLIDVATARNAHGGPHGRLDFESETFVAHSLRAKHNMALREDVDTLVTHSLRADGFDASEDGTGRGTPIVPVFAFGGESDGSTVRNAVDLGRPITGRHGDPGFIAKGQSVRRLTPRECERLQGFPDDYTAVTYCGKSAADGPRYKAIGNSMAVNVMRWLGRRIELVSRIV